jgi:hypothetical protein
MPPEAAPVRATGGTIVRAGMNIGLTGRLVERLRRMAFLSAFSRPNIVEN